MGLKESSGGEADTAGLRGRMADVFEAEDRAAALRLVEEHGGVALGELILSNDFGPELFTLNEMTELCRRYPMSNPIVSLLLGVECLDDRSRTLEGVEHLRFAGSRGLKEACGLLGGLYLVGVDGVIAPDLAEGLKWFGRLGSDDPPDIAERFLFTDEDADSWPYNIFCGRPDGWQWEMVCDLLEEVSDESVIEASLDAIPGSRRHIGRRWVVLDADGDEEDEFA